MTQTVAFIGSCRPITHASLAALGLGLLVGALGLDAVAEEPLRAAVDRLVDVEHIRLDLTVSLMEKSVRGEAMIDFTPVRAVEHLSFDAVGFDDVRVWEADADGKRQAELSVENTGDQIVVSFPRELQRGDQQRIVIAYQVQEPKSGLYFFQPTEAEPDVPYMVWSQGESIGNRHWFPCLDHPNERQTTELIVTTDARYEVLSNGTLVSKEPSPDGKTVRVHWRQSQPHVAYLVTLVVGEFAIIRDTWRGKEVSYYVPQDRAGDARRSFGDTVEMLEFFSERFGIEYPWHKYAQVVVEQFIMGGMENTSATTLYEGVLHDERASLDSSPNRLIAHELGHQWWGDLVTCKDWAHLWLNEGFATYCEVLWAEHKLGREEMDYLLYGKSKAARSGTALKRPVVDRRYPTASSMFDSRVYPKGGWVLHMLRNRVGDDDFFRALSRYGMAYSFQSAETSDLRKTFSELTGLSLEQFFYDWTERAGHPILKIESKYLADDKLVRVKVTQEQSGDPFHFPLLVEIVGQETIDTVLITKQAAEKEMTFYVPMQKRPAQVRIDPDYTLLAEIKETKTRNWWKEQLQHGPRVPERIRAIEHFADKKSDNDRKLLAERLKDDAFWGVRVEAAKGLGKSGGDVSRDALIAGLTTEHPKVRRACADALGKFSDDEDVIAALAAAWETDDPSYFVQAAVLESLAKAQHKPSLEIAQAGLQRDSHKEVIRQAALHALARVESDAAVDLLLEWTKRGHPRDCRRTAMTSLADALTRFDVSPARQKKAVDRLVSSLSGEDVRVRRSAAEALRKLGTAASPALDALTALAEHDVDARVRIAAKESAEAIRNNTPSSSELTRLRKELDKLRKSKETLTDRLDRLESK